MPMRPFLPAAVLAALLLIPACTRKPVGTGAPASSATTTTTAASAPGEQDEAGPAAGQGAARPMPKPEAVELSQLPAVYLHGNAAPADAAIALGDPHPIHPGFRGDGSAPAPRPKASAKGGRPLSARAGYDRKEVPGGWDRSRDAMDRPYNTEEYARIYENPFLEARANPLSTFSIDVDAASYANVRRFLTGNQLPPADAVRIEELINYFDYDYPRPRGDAPFSITTEVAATPWNAETKLVHVGLQGAAIGNDRLPAANLVFLLDVSGSMDSPEKLPLAKRAMRLLVSQLRSEDHVALAVYAGAAGLVLPPTPGSDKAAILEALERLQAGGSTAGAEGLVLAYETARKHFKEGGNNRIVLMTDGDFNVGVSSDAELVRLIEEKRKSGVYLSILGFGMGNYKDSKMEQLADKGNGNYAYIDNVREARKVLVEEMGGTLVTLAKDVKLQVEFNPAKVEAYRLIGYENRVLRDEDFNDDTKDAGELGAGHSVTALYEVVPAGAKSGLPGVDSLKYQKPAASAEAGASSELLTVKFRYKDPDGARSKLIVRSLPDARADWERASDDFRFSAAAAGFGMLLRGSEHRGDLDYAQVLAMAKGAQGRDLQGHRAEFVRLVEAARLLAASQRLGSRSAPVRPD
jgi:Ca-activated chloride channel family protein